eukprot:360908-Chlamydomonas_euryale.AAC.3
MHMLLRKSRLCCLHEGPVLTSTLMQNLGRLILAHYMLASASDLGLSRLPRPRPARGRGHACT